MSYYILPILVGIVQLLFAICFSPGGEGLERPNADDWRQSLVLVYSMGRPQGADPLPLPLREGRQVEII
jgi:hypothetical protein